MQNVAQALARNLRRTRQERAISLSELARTSGVSKATLSGLERGTGNPSIDTVWALAQALNVPFGGLFEEQHQDVVQLRRIDEAPIVSSERGFVGRKLLSRPGRGGLELYVLDLKRGARRKAAPHPPGVIEHVIVLEGRAEVGPDTEPTIIEAGHCLTFSADRAHHYYAVEGPACLLSFTDYP